MIPYKQLSLANSKCGRMVYVYPEKDLRAYPGTIRSTEEYLNFFSATLHEVNLFISYHFSNRYFLFLINGKDTLTNDMSSISGYKIIQYTNYILPRIIILPINISPMLLFLLLLLY